MIWAAMIVVITIEVLATIISAMIVIFLVSLIYAKSFVSLKIRLIDVDQK